MINDAPRKVMVCPACDAETVVGGNALSNITSIIGEKFCEPCKKKLKVLMQKFNRYKDEV
jgi:hypothetical protein